ncbi:MAG: hypothetical protein HY427_00835, partial [Candidatus Levybacteria bacterium]|nr:hypothetical protein [Candidatus Levybacteria bacterium]
MNVLVDSDIWVDFFKSISYAQDLITRLEFEGKIASSILTVTELRAGWTDEQAEERLK